MAIVKDYKIEAGGSAVPFTSGSTHLVGGLTPSTSYNFYVRNRDTVSGLSSSWIGPETESTEAGAFDPSDIPSIVHWWKASSLALADNDPVSTLEDLIGSADLTASGSARPTYKANAGDPYLEFDGVDDKLEATLSALSSDFTYVMVVEYVADGADYERFFDDGVVACFPTVAIGRHLYATINGSGADNAAFPAAPSGVVGLLVEGVGTPASTVTLRYDGVETTGAGSGAAGTGTALKVGTDGSVFMNMRLREFMQFNNDLTGPQFTDLEAYVLAEYGATL
jgi:hypothetical protein